MKVLTGLLATAVAGLSFGTFAKASQIITNGTFSANASSYKNFPGYAGTGMGTSNPVTPTDWTSLGGNLGVNGTDTTTGNPFGPQNQTTDNLGHTIKDYGFLQGNRGGFEQVNLNLLANTTYYLIFDGASRFGSDGNGNYFPNTIGVVVNDGSTDVLSKSSSYGGAQFTYTVYSFTTSSNANGAGSIKFLNEGGAPSPDDTIDVTNVSIVPEPASLSLLGLGAVGFMARRRRA